MPDQPYLQRGFAGLASLVQLSFTPVEFMSLPVDWSLLPSLLAATEDTGGVIAWLQTTWLWTQVALGIGLVIFVHELGHFLAAKTFGVKCEKFYVGFDVPISIGPIKFPRTLGKFTYGETEYGIGILPLGGYVKMLGQDDDPRKAEEEAKRIRQSGEASDAEEKLDPRSYPAKPVWQRMIIISAGVVMNVITGVLFAAFAFFNGVGYTPAVVGGVTPGGPAWQAGVQPGGKVVAVGTLEDDSQLPFSEMQLKIMEAGIESSEAAVPVRLQYGDDTREYQLVTQASPIEPDRRMIGIQSPTGDTLFSELPAMPNSVAADVVTDEDAGAKVVGFDDQTLDSSAIMPITPLLSRIHTAPSQPIELRLVRTDESEHSMTLPPQKAKDFGIQFKIGPIKALMQNGPAEKAGMKVGDQIISVGDDTNIDAYQMVLADVQYDEPMNITVQRGEGDSREEIELSLTPQRIEQTMTPVSAFGEMMSVDSLGFAYEPTAVASEVISGTEASAADGNETIQVGDELREIRVQFASAKDRESIEDELSETAMEALTEGWEIGPTQPLGNLMETIQLLPNGTKIIATAIRPPNGTVVEQTLTVRQSDRFWYDRGLNFTPVESIRKADSLGMALALGVSEAKRRMADVGRFLSMLVRGKVKAKFVGGPIRIAQMASHQAEKGLSAQLMFLTMLSMNLAILNFLPIPALDGGHMVFLTAELIRGKKVDEAMEMRLTFVGVLALLALMIFVFTNDILNLL
ncbi:site-2 protease family protein [Rhodopirellula europaea]|uniref:Metalloproteinase n=1 Tax=Rhodopirellula europaea SH398 TaxID=1263868 RepID=M5SN87_9BACT|nr:site-2 protease family protein [Rhodopirellula europaea]EMI29247.1 metalloproteinase [Rhodopirellula europaea SH398]